MKDKDAPHSILSFGKYVRKPSSESEETKDAAEPIQEARARSRAAFMLNVRLKDGTIEMFDYASLRRGTYKPDGTLALHFGEDTVNIKGTGLERLRIDIAEHRVRLIQEGIQAEQDANPEEATFIERIEIDREGAS